MQIKYKENRNPTANSLKKQEAKNKERSRGNVSALNCSKTQQQVETIELEAYLLTTEKAFLAVVVGVFSVVLVHSSFLCIGQSRNKKTSVKLK